MAILLDAFRNNYLGSRKSKNGDKAELLKKILFAGPKRGRPTPGFSIFVSTSVRSSVSAIRKRLLHAHYTWDPNIFTDSEPLIKCQLGVAIRGAPDTPNAPYGGAKVFLGGMTDFPF